MMSYSQLFNTLLLPSYDAVNRRKCSQHREFLEKSQWWPAERLRDFQWQELQRLLKHAFETVPFYQKKYKEHGISLGDIRNWEDFSRVPTLTKKEIQLHGAELCSMAWQGRLLPEATGGSSGVPTRFFITVESYDWRSAATQRAYRWSGCSLGERTLHLWGSPIGYRSFWRVSKDKLFYSFRRELVINTFHQSDQFWADTWQRSAQFRPRFLVGYVSSLEQFVSYGRQHGLKLPELRAVLAAAEPVYDGFRRLVESTLQVPLFNTYGSREFMSIGAECERHQGLHVNGENILLQTKNADEGPSEFLVTDLHNYGMPFIRYEIGDVGTLDFEVCPCGRGLPKISSIEGRTLDLLRGKDGRIVPGIFFPHLLKDIPEVSEFQVEQKCIDEIVVRMVVARPLSTKSRELLQDETVKVFGNTARLELQEVHSIVRRTSGKRRVTIGLDLK